MKCVKEFFGKIVRIRGFKYIVVVILAILIVGFIDQNSVWNHFCNQRKIAELEQEIEQYKGQYESDLKEIRQMDNDPKIVEKIARERYFMKKADEDIFVLDTDVEAE